MSLVQKLLLRLLAYLALPGACAWYLASTVSPPGGAAWAVGAAPFAFVAGAAAALAALVAPVERAIEMPPGEAPAGAAIAAQKLPGRYAALLLALACALLVSLCALLVRRGLAPDLAVAVGAAGGALAIVSTMLGHGVAATGLAPVVAALGAPHLRRAELEPGAAGTRPEPGTVTGRLLAFGCGLAAAAALLVGAVGHIRHGFGSELAYLGLALLAMAALVAWLTARALTAPAILLGEAAERAASGDLTVSPPVVREEELAGLAAAFGRMILTLKRIVREVGEAAEGVTGGAREVALAGERLRGTGPEGQGQVLAVQAAVEAMHGSVGMVGKGVDALAGHIQSAGTVVDEIVADLEAVKREAAELEIRSGAAAGDVDRLVEASRRAHAQVGSLGGYASRAQRSLSAVSDSLSGLETSAIASQLAAAQAAEMAEQAGAVVKEAVSGIERLRAAVGDAKKRVTALGRRSDDIDHILDFIGEVAGRTNLLSLNASIIATQAGEHGKAFAVVADQIGELAAQISASTKSIAEIIGAVRDDVNGTARLIDRGDDLAAEGVARVRRSLDALQAIAAATARGHETAAAIREAVQTHAQSAWEVSDSVAAIVEGFSSLGEALQTVNRSVSAVESVSRAVRGMAGGVVQAIEQQSSVGRRKRPGQSLERIDTMLADIRRAVENHDAAARRVREALSQLTRTAEQDAVAVELSGVASGLEKRSRTLAESVGSFRT
jgi:methyl-accepting chemotaxis protein